MAVHHQLAETQHLSAQVEGIAKSGLLSFLEKSRYYINDECTDKLPQNNSNFTKKSGARQYIYMMYIGENYLM